MRKVEGNAKDNTHPLAFSKINIQFPSYHFIDKKNEKKQIMFTAHEC